MQILLFWYIISKAVEGIIIDKTYILKEIFRNSTYVKIQLDNFVQGEEYIKIYNKSILDKDERYNFNTQLTWWWMISPFSVVIGTTFLGIIYTVYIHKYTHNNTLKLDKTDVIILFLLLLCFLTEIIFIFTLVLRYVYISDMDIIIFIMTSGILNLIQFPTVVPDFTFPPALSFNNTYAPFSIPPTPSDFTFPPF